MAFIGLGLLLTTCLGRPSQFSREFFSYAFSSALTTSPVSTRRYIRPSGEASGITPLLLRLHSYSDYATCEKFQNDLAIRQDLVFKVCKEVDSLHFPLEVLDNKGSQIFQLLSSLHGSHHPTEHAPTAPVDSEAILVMDLQLS